MSKKIQEVIKTLSCFLMIILTAVSIAAVLWRLLAKSIDAMDGTAFYWANEFELLVLNWVVVLGMMIVFITNRDIRITMLYDRFSPIVRLSVNRIFYLVETSVFAVIAIWGFKLAIKEWKTPTSSLMWSRGCFVYFPYVVLGAFVTCFGIYRLIVSFTRPMKVETALDPAADFHGAGNTFVSEDEEDTTCTD